jgi:hypothetical protein
MFRELYWLYYATQLLLLLFILIAVKEVWQKKLILNKETIQMFGLFVFFPVWATLTAFWSLYPSSTFLKGMNFVFVVTGLFSALSLWIKYINGNFFNLFLPANLLTVTLSLLSLVSGIPTDAWNIGHGLSFAGVFSHQNVMGMALMFTLPGVFGLLNSKRISSVRNNNSSSPLEEQAIEKTKKANVKYFFFSILILNLFLIIITYSRSVMVGLFTGLIFYLIITKAYKFLMAISLLFTLVFLIYLTITPINEKINSVLSKHGWGILATRTILWVPSFEAAKLGALKGIGYGMTAPGIYVYGPEDMAKSQGSYYREKGNSVLAIIEETGLIGIIIIFYFFILWFRKIFKDKPTQSFLILASFTFGFVVQSNFEGWVGGGSPILQLFLPVLIYPMLIKSLKINPKELSVN